MNGRDAIELEQKAKYDGEYAQNVSFLFDLKCLWMTVVKVIKREDIVEGAHETKKPEDAA